MAISIDDLLAHRQMVMSKKQVAEDLVSDYGKELAAIDLIVGRLREQALPNQGALDLPVSHPTPSKIALSFAQSVRQLPPTFGDHEFDKHDIERALKAQGVKLPEKNLRARLAMEMKHMLKKGLIVLVRKGTGTEPHRYRRVPDAERAGRTSVAAPVRPGVTRVQLRPSRTPTLAA